MLARGWYHARASCAPPKASKQLCPGPATMQPMQPCNFSPSSRPMLATPSLHCSIRAATLQPLQPCNHICRGCNAHLGCTTKSVAAAAALQLLQSGCSPPNCSRAATGWVRLNKPNTPGSEDRGWEVRDAGSDECLQDCGCGRFHMSYFTRFGCSERFRF